MSPRCPEWAASICATQRFQDSVNSWRERTHIKIKKSFGNQNGMNVKKEGEEEEERKYEENEEASKLR